MHTDYREDREGVEIAAQARSFVDNYNGPDFFKDLGLFLSDLTKMEYILIGKISADGGSVNTVCLTQHGVHIGNMTYALRGTPCENVVGRSTCYYPCRVQSMFPEDKELQDLGIESYIGTPIFGKSREPVGLIVLMDKKPMVGASAMEMVFAAICKRVANEMENVLENTNMETARN